MRTRQNKLLRIKTKIFTKRNIAIGLCFFLTVAPILGSFIYADTTFGLYVGNLLPYVHLTMPQEGGLPFGEGIGGLVGLLIVLLGIVGFAIYLITRFRHIKTFKWLLYITIFYCGFRAIAGLLMNFLVFRNYDTKTIFVVVLSVLTDVVWAVLCYWAIRWLTNKSTAENKAV